MRRVVSGLLLLVLPCAVRGQDAEPARRLPPAAAAALWTAAQLVPSPVLVTGGSGAGAGMRWQLSLLVWSYGVVERPLRSVLVHPIARHAGAVELYASPAWLCCAPQQRTSWMLQLGGRIYVPLVGRGENWVASFGAAYYRASPRHGAAIELGVYTLSSIVGLTVTVAPWLTAREVSTALTFHYF